MSKKKEIVPSIGRLPEEMQAYILSKLDGKTAIIAKRVCKLWRKIVHGKGTNSFNFACASTSLTHSLVHHFETFPNEKEAAEDN